MAKGDPKRSKGKMTAYAFFVQMSREEHKKKNPEVPVNFAEFSKKCSERWKVFFFYIFPATLSWISHFLVTDLQCSSRWLFSSSLLRLILSLLRILFYFWRFCKGLRLSSPFASILTAATIITGQLNRYVLTALRSCVLQTMSGKEKSKFDEMAKADKVRYDREMKDYGPAKGGKKKKDPNAPKRPP